MSTSPVARPPSPALGLPRRKPMARADRTSLFEREVRERLSSPAIELLLGRARVLSEGGPAKALPRPDGTRGPDPFFGSTMLTIDLADLADAVREPLDESTAARVAALLTADARAGKRIRAIAEREACRVARGRVEPR